MSELKPFVKWAGGKRQLLPQLLPLVPQQYERYVEPFVGGGAMLLHLRPKLALINDLNPLLMACWRQLCCSRLLVQSGLIPELEKCVRSYNQSSVKDAWYLGRRKWDPEGMSPMAQAVWFIVMNHLGFNGLWRVNKKGECNVPWGKYTKLSLDLDNLRAINDYFSQPDVRITTERLDFEELLQIHGAGPGDFWYLDPPYVPVSKTANFTAYSKGGFGMKDQERLRSLCGELDRVGACFMLSNSDTPEVRELWGSFFIDAVKARRAINSKGDRRGPVGELVVRNYR